LFWRRLGRGLLEIVLAKRVERVHAVELCPPLDVVTFKMCVGVTFVIPTPITPAVHEVRYVREVNVSVAIRASSPASHRNHDHHSLHLLYHLAGWE